MAIVSFKEMLEDARKNHYAVPMFDASNTTMMRAAVEVAAELGSPVILAAIPPDIPGDSLGYWANSALYAAKQVKVPVCLHLDHSADVVTCKRCMETGFQSVMIDYSARSFEENAAITKQVAELVHPHGLHVEAELGHVASGITGAANAGTSESGELLDSDTVLTSPESVARFVEETDVDALAISIGTTHGVYISTPKLEIELLKKINAVSPVPLVLHGGSGTPADQLAAAIENGIAKINIYSELTAAWNSTMRDFLNKREQMTCWFSVTCAEPDQAMREAMREKILVFKSNNRY
ncbi:class II fructose-bisphosphate aldolase [uncultured Victivallis sp.]|uniref:class II fructose-bisphosphate aldolase n=1 Tax=uncultured Victivallis sp. TaxID=354118 RepID=UPI00259AB329|nr:class II fructose-bisphosphate aldolase [uncultured Victivallis sp.]